MKPVLGDLTWPIVSCIGGWFELKLRKLSVLACLVRVLCIAEKLWKLSRLDLRLKLEMEFGRSGGGTRSERGLLTITEPVGDGLVLPFIDIALATGLGSGGDGKLFSVTKSRDETRGWGSSACWGFGIVRLIALFSDLPSWRLA